MARRTRTKQHTTWWGWIFHPGRVLREVARTGGSRRGRTRSVSGAEGGSWLWPSSRKSHTRRTRRRGKSVYRVRGQR